MIIELGSSRYQQLFGGRDYRAKFESRLPDHAVLTAALRDPSLSVPAIDAVLADVDPGGLLRWAGLEDLQLGSQILVYSRAVASRVGGLLTLPGNGVLTAMSDGLADILRDFKWPTRPSAEQVQALLADAAFGIGMRALGALGPIGKIAAAIVGLAKGIIDLVRQRRELARLDAERREALLYAALPPLQEPDTQVDAWYVDTVLRRLVEGGSWTRIFAPRFDADAWTGIARNGGYAFAPGDPDKDLFKTSGGVGLIPGLDQITSVIQVALDWRPYKTWNGSGRWPIRPSMITDVGKFYVNTGRLAAIAWAWATAYDASPDLYKVDAADLHVRWRRYCDGGLRFLSENTKDWLGNHGKGRVLSGDPKYIFGSAIGCAIGGWRCMPDWRDGIGNLSVEPGWIRDQLSTQYGIGREILGCVVDPPSLQVADEEGGVCMRTLYDVHIRGVLAKVQERQRYFLWHSLVAAYVKADFDAFRDRALQGELFKARKALLEHPDRALVILDDVADDEPGLPGSGKTWKAQLIERGVKRAPPFVKLGRRITGGPQPGTLAPTDEPPPVVPEAKVAMPWGELAGGPGDGGSMSRGRLGWVAGGLLAVGGGAALAYHLRQRSKQHTHKRIR